MRAGAWMGWLFWRRGRRGRAGRGFSLQRWLDLGIWRICMKIFKFGEVFFEDFRK